MARIVLNLWRSKIMILQKTNNTANWERRNKITIAPNPRALESVVPAIKLTIRYKLKQNK